MRSFAVIPGAGLSQRMGTNKLLLPWSDGTLIEHVLRQWERSNVDHIVLVTRTPIVQGLDKSRWAALQRVHLLTPDPPPQEMKVSVLKALEFISEQWKPEPTDTWLLAPADLATLEAHMVDRMLKVFSQAADQHEMAIPRYHDKRGHPVLFTWRLAMEVSRLAADENLSSLTEKKFPRLEVAMPGNAPRDLDTWEDYQALMPEGTRHVTRPG